MSSFLKNNLWWETAGERIETLPINENKSVDVVIVGGGFTGTACALRLAEKGCNVLLLEANEIGYGAAGRNVGLVNAGLWVEPDKVESILGIEAGEKLNALLQNGPELVFSTIAHYKIECEATRAGNLYCAHSPMGFSKLKERHRQYEARGINAVLLSRDETEAKTGTSVFHGALLRRDTGTIQPLAYVRGLARAAMAAGASLHQKTPVTKIMRKEGAWHIQTPHHSIKSEALILATHAYHQDLDIAGKPSYTLIHYFQLATQPLSEKMLKRILPERQGCWDTASVISSIRRDQAGRLIIGSIGSLNGITASIHCHWARHKLHQFFPFLEDIQFEHTWGGRIACTANRLPKIINLGNNALSIYGFNGRGITTGTVFGNAAADYLLTKDERILPLSPISSYTEKFNKLKETYYEFGAAVTHALA